MGGGGHQLDRPVVAVHRHRAAPRTRRQRRDLRHHRCARTLDDVVREIRDAVLPELVQHLPQPFAADVVAGGERVHIALGLHRLTSVRAHHVEQCPVHLSALGELHEREVDPLGVDVLRIRTVADAADVDEVAGAREDRHEAAAMKARRRHHEVVEVAGALPWIVGEVDVAVRHRLQGKGGDEVVHRLRHGIDVSGRSGDCLREHSPLQIEDTRGEIAALAHHRGEGGAQQGLRLLLHHREKAIPHDLHVYAVNRSMLAHGPSGAARRSSTR